MKYKYQMHVHTSPCSKCAKMTPEELAQGLYARDYAGCVLTNHFRHGNSGFKNIPWKECVAEYEKDYHACKAEFEKRGLDVLFGIEEGIGGGFEILCYCITPELLYAHPELDTPDLKVWSNVLHANGGIIIQAHPFRRRDYILKYGVTDNSLIDGIEINNACNADWDNLIAESYALTHKNMMLIGGGDAHQMAYVCNGGIETDVRLTDNSVLRRVLNERDFKCIGTFVI